ncbi:polysaccharide deacetylase [Rhodoblastus sp.]|uniref:polysaccharide deacetylase n=1 Tax=Rhodoblastus sp. TaxID=1962975 RepID=UPI003F9598B7
MNKALALLLALWPLAATGARATDRPSPAKVEAPLGAPLQPLQRVEDYRVILKTCSAAGKQRVAVREMRVGGEKLLLTVDPQTLAASLEYADGSDCSEAQGTSRFLELVDHYAADMGKQPSAGATWLENAGLKHGRGEGAYLTGDLCPSRKPLDRAFLQSLEKPGEAAPVALAVSGLWLTHHPADFAWLRREKAEGRLAITFVNHSYSHPYRPGLPDGQNFLLEPGLDKDREVLDLERLLIANGETPSVFFRFPGLISDREWMATLRRDHLIPLGSDAWLAVSPAKPPGGAILLVHANGNEPFGLNRFDSLRQKGELPKPFRPINEAP